MAGLLVLSLSFSITLMVIDGTNEGGGDGGDVSLAEVPLTNDDGTPRFARASKLDDLPPPRAGNSYSIGWDGLDGLNVREMGAAPTGGGNLALSLVATRELGLHRLGILLSGVPVNRTIRTITWIKAPQGTRINVDVRDGKAQTGEPQNHGSAAIDLTSRTLLESTGNVRAAVEAGPGDWVKVPVQMQSADGVVVVYLGLLGPADNPTFSGTGQQIIFGGIELTMG